MNEWEIWKKGRREEVYFLMESIIDNLCYLKYLSRIELCY